MGTGSLACSCLFANCSTLQIFLLVSQVKTDFNMSGAHSGVAIREEVLEAFQELKIGHKHRFVLFKMTDNETRFSWLFGLLTLPESNPRCCTPPQRTPSRRSWLELALKFKLLTCLKSTTKPFLIRLFEFK